MAKLECNLNGDFRTILQELEDEVLSGSISASKEGASNYEVNGVQCAVRVYERYSMMGGNRVSLNITLIGNEEHNFLSAISAGGSQGVLFKFNTLGEEAFLDSISDVVKKYKQ